MKKQTSYTITISGGIVKDSTINKDGSITITMDMRECSEPTVKVAAGLTFIGIPAHTISIEDDFMWYAPTDEMEIDLHNQIIKVLKSHNDKFEDFFIPEDYTKVKLFGTRIHDLGYGTASCSTWINGASLYNCKLLNHSQYIMLLAWMLKCLTEKAGWETKKAWNAIARNSELLSNLDWKNTFGVNNFLTSARKYIIPDDPVTNRGCYTVSGGLNGRDWRYPLAQIVGDCRRDCSKENCSYHVYGFLVLNR